MTNRAQDCLDFTSRRLIADGDINLDNFEEHGHDQRRHVLTSPRSVRAAFNVGIAPRSLIPTPLEEFDRGDGYANAYVRYAVGALITTSFSPWGCPSACSFWL